MLSGLMQVFLVACDGGADSDSVDQDAASTGPAQCSTDACGGDPAGEWVVSEVCFESAQQPGGCADTYYEIVGFSVEGTVSFGEDGRYESALAETYDLLFHVGPECLEGATCDEYETALDDGYECVGVSNGACDCTVTPESSTIEDAGGWSASGDELSMVSGTDGEESEVWVTEFCVLGDTMWWNLVSDWSLLLTRD